MGAVVLTDAREYSRRAAESVADLQSQLLRISVERPPKSSGILSPPIATSLLELLLCQYHSHFSLFKRSLCAVPRPAFECHEV